MKVAFASFLIFLHGRVRDDFAQVAVLGEVSQQLAQLDVQDTHADIGTIARLLVGEQRGLDLRPLRIARERDEEGRLGVVTDYRHSVLCDTVVLIMIVNY